LGNGHLWKEFDHGFRGLHGLIFRSYSGGEESSVGETPTGAGGTPALPRKLNSYNFSLSGLIPEICGRFFKACGMGQKAVNSAHGFPGSIHRFEYD
jgi:hypothetical protein